MQTPEEFIIAQKMIDRKVTMRDRIALIVILIVAAFVLWYGAPPFLNLLGMIVEHFIPYR